MNMQVVYIYITVGEWTCYSWNLRFVVSQHEGIKMNK